MNTNISPSCYCSFDAFCCLVHSFSIQLAVNIVRHAVLLMASCKASQRIQERTFHFKFGFSSSIQYECIDDECRNSLLLFQTFLTKFNVNDDSFLSSFFFPFFWHLSFIHSTFCFVDIEFHWPYYVYTVDTLYSVYLQFSKMHWDYWPKRNSKKNTN